MRRFFISVLIASCCQTLGAQTFFEEVSMPEDISIDEAIVTMKKTSAEFLTGQFHKIDATGIDQYVDVEILKVHNFSDFSFGAVLPELEKVFSVVDADGNGIMPAAKMARMLEYAKSNMTKLVAYAAIVDYNGITKYHEKIGMSKLFFFDWTGTIIGIRSEDFARNDYLPNLPKTMCSRIALSLASERDPLFPMRHMWKSDTKRNSMSGYNYEMTWCCNFITDGPDETGIERGQAHLFYYQVQQGTFTSKSVTKITADYILRDGKIEIAYHMADVSMYLVGHDYIDSFDMDDVYDMPKEKLSYTLINTPKVKKVIRSSSDVPRVFEFIDAGSFKMADPISPENIFTFKKDSEGLIF